MSEEDTYQRNHNKITETWNKAMRAKALRDKEGLRTTEVARRMGVSRSTAYKWLKMELQLELPLVFKDEVVASLESKHLHTKAWWPIYNE